ncbi:hypothetical protein SpolCp017 (plastid) [Spinacia oleracea]|uniref:Uncharacterized protein n=1 Tax=Spinacia oleracea TaxID=3562 RepID=A0A9R0JGF0_SPIOL|nr:hypothetical protein SpolCp017 [Spinacia oleracea]CAB88720.1 hypothetical protein [Spinacia oleracea]
MPERLMGTDCKFVGNMSTLVQIQLGPIISSSIIEMKVFVLPKRLIYIIKESIFRLYTVICLLYFFVLVFREIWIRIQNNDIKV